MTAASRDTELALLTPVLELTVLVAQAGARAVPKLDPPELLRPFLGFTRRVPRPALKAARRVLDDDGSFRERLAAAATPDVVGEAGMLFVARPEGWEERIGELIRAQTVALGDVVSERSERTARRRLEAAERAVERLEASLAASRAEGDGLKGQLAEERRQRARAVADAQQIARELAEVGGERDAAQERLLAAQTAADDRSLVIAELRARLASSEESLRVRGSFEDALGTALSSVQEVHATLLLLRGDGAATPPTARAATSSAASSTATGTPRTAASTTGRGRRRTPPRLPGGVFDDSAEAVHHYLRVPGIQVIVDGFNVAKHRWPTLGPPDLRDRLVAATSGLVARSGAQVHVVFDGALDGSTAKRRSERVRVTYTPAGVEADDAVLDLIDALPTATPVVVVSSDARVADGARRRGAATLSSAAFAGSWSSRPH